MNRSILMILVTLVILAGLGGVVYSTLRSRQAINNQIPNENTESPTPSNLMPTPTQNITEVMDSIGAFRYMEAAIKLSGLNQTLTNGDEYTIFAPPDQAVQPLIDNPGDLVNNRNRINSILRYHVVKGRIPSGQLLNSPTLKTIDGQDLQIKTEENTVTVGNARIIDVDIPATNGVIHVIDAVLIPSK